MEQERVPEKGRKLLALEETLCDHCLGRQFARLSHGMENYERGRIVRVALEEEEEIDFDADVPDEQASPTDCDICEGLFTKVEHFAQRVLDAFERYELSTYLIGFRPPADVVQREEILWEDVGVEWTEPLKGEMNRLIGKIVGRETGKDVDFETPDIVAVVDATRDAVEVQINAIFVFGRYNKYARGIPQTEWTCNACKGMGCHHCDFAGKMYEESVEELIAPTLVEAAKGTDAKFHGAGREDIDARCLGKRPFVIEVREPEIRSLQLEDLQETINEEADEKIEIFDLRFVNGEMVQRVKDLGVDKTYRATIALSEAVDEEKLERLQELKGKVEQRTPSRVEQRRADKVRRREVKSVDVEKTGEKEIELTVRTEAGTYVKELISSDGGRTEPSVAGILDCEAECTALDVLAIHEEL